MPERFYSYKEAAGLLGVPYSKIQRAAKRGMFPVYRLYNSRPLVRISEIVAVMQPSTEGGQS
jgi:excisionase family DNA binding protein